MEIDEFIIVIKDQFDEVLDITKGTNFKSIDGWSSLVALSIIAAVDEEYDVTLNGNDIERSETIEDLYKIVLAALD